MLLINMAPEVGLEPTTLRLTARKVHFSELPKIAISCSFSANCEERDVPCTCQNCPDFATIFKGSPYESPYSVLASLLAF